MIIPDVLVLQIGNAETLFVVELPEDATPRRDRLRSRNRKCAFVLTAQELDWFAERIRLAEAS